MQFKQMFVTIVWGLFLLIKTHKNTLRYNTPKEIKGHNFCFVVAGLIEVVFAELSSLKGLSLGARAGRHLLHSK